MVSSFLIMTQLLHLRDNLLALILPLAVSSFNIIIMRTFFTTTVPDSLVESGKIDGASQLRIFFGLFLSFAYWNDWWQALMYLNNQDLYPLQYVLISIERSIDFVTKNAAYMGMSAVEISAKIPQDGVKMALVVIAVLPIACSYPFFQRYFVSGLTIGAVKG